jgi:hypothetical protein
MEKEFVDWVFSIRGAKRVRTKPLAQQTLRVVVARGFLFDPFAFAM